MLFSEELSSQLVDLAIDKNKIQQQACFKAQLFAPYGKTNNAIRPLNKKCIKGSWIRFDDFNTAEFKNWEYYIPFKQEWLITLSMQRNYVNHYETMLDLNLRMLKENAPMLWAKKPDETLEKLFVVWW